jgi:hypothetical protein
MDIKEIRTMIRQSIRDQVKNLVKERLKPPTTFEKFNFIVNESIEGIADRPSFEDIYCMWKNISLETLDIGVDRDIISEWNSSLRYYVDNLEVSSRTKEKIFNSLKR